MNIEESKDEFLKENDITHKEWEKMCANVAKGIEEGFPFQSPTDMTVLDVSNNTMLKELKCRTLTVTKLYVTDKLLSTPLSQWGEVAKVDLAAMQIGCDVNDFVKDLIYRNADKKDSFNISDLVFKMIVDDVIFEMEDMTVKNGFLLSHDNRKALLALGFTIIG